MRCFNVKHCCVLTRLCVCGVIVCVSWKPLGCPDHLLWWPSGFLGHPGLFQWPQTEIWSFQLQNPKKQGNTWLTRCFYNACFFLALKWYTVKKKTFYHLSGTFGRKWWVLCMMVVGGVWKIGVVTSTQWKSCLMKDNNVNWWIAQKDRRNVYWKK